MTTEVKYQDQTLTYAGEEFFTTPDGIKEMIEKKGVAILPKVLNEQECKNMNDGMWNTAEFLTSKMEIPLKRFDPSTYFSVAKLFPKDGGLFQHFGWGHAQYVWDVRSNPKISEGYERLFGTQDLLVSFDGINCGLGPLIEDPKISKAQKGCFEGKHNLHCEQRYSQCRIFRIFLLIRFYVKSISRRYSIISKLLLVRCPSVKFLVILE